MPDTSVPPCMLLVTFKLLPQCWNSDGVSLSKFMCGFFKRDCLGLQKFLLLTQFLLVFAAGIFGVLSPGTRTLGWDEPLAPEISLLTFYPPHVYVEPAHLCLAPPNHLDGRGFFNSVFVRFPFNWISDGSE